jgi:hypothetical protein
MAQRTADQARLVFTVGFGQNSGGGTLWSIGNQPFFATAPADTLAVARRFRSSLSALLSGTYFPGDHLGFSAEAMLIGLGTSDGCRIVSHPSGSGMTSDLCTTINGAERAATAAELSVGVVYRVLSHEPVHPYVRLNAGLAITQESLIKTEGTVNTPDGPAALTLYDDQQPTRVHPYLGAGLGVIAVIGAGYQMRFEVRNNYVRVPTVTGPTVLQNQEPSRTTVGKNLLSFVVGFDVVLERKRGRRY